MFLSILLFLNMVSANEWLLYSTDKISGDHDCLFYDSRLFCRRPNDSLIIRESVCDGTLWSMKDLKRNNVTIDMLFQWLQPHDNIERYSRFLQESSEGNSVLENETICNCSSNQFGVDCSYESVTDSTIGEVLNEQLLSPWQRTMQITACFVDGIQCNAGLLCLEWRQVCDGIVQCEDGIDEFNCDLLEFHHCASDEFQYRNGMCISQEFLFDGTIDCMDKSDEQEIPSIFGYLATCPIKPKFDCDEFLCKKSEFSCGDGQCVPWTSVINHEQPCENRRDAFYRCEILVEKARLFTSHNGLCTITTNSILPISCTISLQLLLTGQRRTVAYDYLVTNCPPLIPYPSSAILTPNLKFFYNKSTIETFYDVPASFARQISRSPHLWCLTGLFICNGSKITLNSDYCSRYDEFLALAIHPFFPVSHIFCNMVLTMPLK